MAPFCDGIHYACDTTCHETPGMNLSLMFGTILMLGINILLIVLMLYNQGKSRKYLRFLRAAGPLTAVVLGTTFAKVFHPPSISLVSQIYSMNFLLHNMHNFRHCNSDMNLVKATKVIEKE